MKFYKPRLLLETAVQMGSREYSSTLHRYFFLKCLFQRTGTVTVNVDNENDHSPSCKQSTGTHTISENAGMVIMFSH